MIRAGALALMLAAPAAVAQEVVEVPGLLTDEDFYRAVACAAPPGGACAKPFVRWDASRPIRISLRALGDAYLGRRAKVATSAVKLGIRALNAAEAGFRLAEVPVGEPAEIEVWFLDQPQGEMIEGTGIPGVDGAPLGKASTRALFNHDTGFIEHAAIVFSSSLSTEDLRPVMLEELVQAMGLMTNIQSSAYAGVSVLAQGGTATRKLGLQDIMALRRHYARN